MQTLTLQQIFDIVAEEKARRHFEKVSFLKSKDNFKEIKKQRVEANLTILQAKVKESKPEFDLWYDEFEYYHPFTSLICRVELPDRIVILADTKGLDGEYTCFYRNKYYEISNEDFILKLTQEQRENCFVIYKGVLQNFKVENNEVVYEDVLLVEESPKKEEKLSKRQKKSLNKDEKLVFLENRVRHLMCEMEEVLEMIEDIKSSNSTT